MRNDAYFSFRDKGYKETNFYKQVLQARVLRNREDFDMKRTMYDRMMDLIDTNKKRGEDKNIGKKVGNGTLLVEEIGRGAMGAIYLGYDTKLDRQVAVKVLLREMFKDEKQFEILKTLLIKEGRNLARVKHKGVIEIYEMDDEFPALIMELIEDGEDLKSYLYKKRGEWGTLGFRLWFLSIMEQVAFALGAAHAQGVVHKDLKFGNVMIYKDSDGNWVIKVIDFGLAQSLTHVKLTHGVTLMGSPSYMAPEQWEDHWQLDAKADVYSFGVMLYEILMQRDFQESDDNLVIKANAKDSMYARKRVGHLPIDQRTVFEFLLAVEKSRRAGGMLEVVGVLRNLRLALMHRDQEAPGTSFPPIPTVQKKEDVPSSHAQAEAAEDEFEDSLETPAPVQVPSDPPIPEPKRHDKTILGHLGIDESPASKAVDPSGESVEVSVSDFEVVDSVEAMGDFDTFETAAIDDAATLETSAVVEPSARRNWKRPLWVTLVILVIGVPIALYSLRENNTSFENHSDPVEETLPKPKAMKPAPVVKAPEKPKPVKPVPVVKKPEPKKLPPVVTPPKPLPPKPPKLGELPSLGYTVHLFNQENAWCLANDQHKAKFDTSPLWRAWCLRKRVVKLYQRDRNNPEVAIALMDEVKAHLCFYENLFRRKGKYRVKDPDLTKECGRIKNLIRKRFTYNLQGKRIHAVDRYLTARAPHRAKIRAAWKKAHPDPK